jgi:hypothetical protein
MWRATKAVLAVCIIALPLVSQASAAKRVALVIGNDAYASLPSLEKAVNDARAVADALEMIGFNVHLGENLTRRETNRKLADFEAAISPGDTAFFFFAGHGVALAGENYLIPSDMPEPHLGEEGLVRDEAHAVDDLVTRVRARGAAAALFVLDACRDNPFAAAGMRSIGTTRGLTRVEAPSGVFILFSAGAGQSALDRLPEGDANPNSVFTRKLLPLLTIPGLSHVALAKRVQQEVSALAGTAFHLQQPAYYDQIIGEIFLLPADSDSDGAGQPVSPVSAAAAAWAIVNETDSIAVLEAFAGKFPDSVYATFAHGRLRELREREVAARVPVEPSPKAERPAQTNTDLVGQRAIYYFQGGEGQSGEASEGTATWANITKDGNPAIRATLSIPERDVQATVTIYQNRDPSLPTSHMVEIEFRGHLGPIQRVPSLVLKQTEQARGQSLAGAAVPVTSELFWIALSDDAEQVQGNLQLLREGRWFDLPILFEDQTRALLTFEKGASGVRVFETVMAMWN